MAPVIFKEEPVKKLMNEHVANIKKKYEGKIDGKDQATLIRERYIGSLEALHAYKPLVMDFLKIRLALRQLDGNLRGVMREQKRATKRIGKFRKGQYSSMRLRGTQPSTSFSANQSDAGSSGVSSIVSPSQNSPSGISGASSDASSGSLAPKETKQIHLPFGQKTQLDDLKKRCNELLVQIGKVPIGGQALEESKEWLKKEITNALTKLDAAYKCEKEFDFSSDSSNDGTRKNPEARTQTTTPDMYITRMHNHP